MPMLADHQLTLVGYDPGDPDSYGAAALAARPGLRHASDSQLRGDPGGVARAAVDVAPGTDRAYSPTDATTDSTTDSTVDSTTGAGPDFREACSLLLPLSASARRRGQTTPRGGLPLSPTLLGKPARTALSGHPPQPDQGGGGPQ